MNVVAPLIVGGRATRKVGDVICVERGSEAGEHAGTQSGDDIIGSAVAGEDNALYARPDGAHLLEQGEVFIESAVGAGDDDAEGSLAQSVQGVDVPGSILQRQTCGSECAADLLAHLRVTSNDEDPAHRHSEAVNWTILKLLSLKLSEWPVYWGVADDQIHLRGRLGEVFLKPGVVGVDEFFGGAVEDYLAFVEDQEFGAVVDAVVGDLLDLFSLRIEAAAGEEVGVLNAMSDDERSSLGDVALFDDEVDDGGGGDGVEAAGGGVVEDEIGMGDDGAGDGDAAAHSSGEFGRDLIDGVFEGDELERFDDAAVDLLLGDVIFVKAVGDVVTDGEGVEEGRLLEDHADAAAEFEEVDFGHGGDVVAEDVDGSGVGLEEAVDELHEDGFAAACRAEDDAGFAALDGEGDVLEDGFDVEDDGNIVDDDDGLL